MSWVVLKALAGKIQILKHNSRVKIGKSLINIHSDLEYNKLYEVHQGTILPYQDAKTEITDVVISCVKALSLDEVCHYREITDVTGDNSSYFDSKTAQSLSLIHI